MPPLIKADEITVAIPAAGRVPEGVLSLSNISCPAMIPVAGRPVIHWTMSYLRSLGLRRFCIAVARRGMFVEDFVECAFGRDCEISFVVPSKDGGVGRTVFELCQAVTTPSMLVVLGDTHFQFGDPAVLAADDPFVLVQPVEDSYRWCVAEVDEAGEVRALRDKEGGLPPPLEALIGVYHFPDVELVRRAAGRAVEEAEAGSRRTEFASILNLVRAERPLRAIRAGDWLDCGNADRQASSHRALLQKRDFNELSIDPVLGTITKRSRQVEKFIDEINYLRLMPAELSVLFPRVLGYSTDWQDPWLKMEYYGYPTLSEVFLFENLDPAIWQRIFEHLNEIVVTGFMQWRRPLADGALRDMAIGKTRKRIEAMKAPADLLKLVQHEGEVKVNGRPMANLPLLWRRLDAEVDRLAEDADAVIIHGDLCLSNILYDLRSRVCKLIDPRGSFGAAGIFGDIRYDIAKLYHSVYGFYDFIVNDLFRAEISGLEIRVDVRVRQQHREILDRFERTFFRTFARRDVLLLTGLLFASMPALHYDAPARQIAMYARALELIDEGLALPLEN